jgi:hypothetical protein
MVTVIKKGTHYPKQKAEKTSMFANTAEPLL